MLTGFLNPPRIFPGNHKALQHWCRALCLELFHHEASTPRSHVSAMVTADKAGGEELSATEAAIKMRQLDRRQLLEGDGIHLLDDHAPLPNSISTQMEVGPGPGKAEASMKGWNRAGQAAGMTTTDVEHPIHLHLMSGSYWVRSMLKADQCARIKRALNVTHVPKHVRPYAHSCLF